MCIICVKPYGKEFPTQKTMKTMYTFNSDGCGYMHADGKKVIIKKGFTTFDSFYQSIKAESNNFTSKDVFAMHFRIATHGGINRENTQPFPLSADVNKLMSLKQKAPIGIAHNGIITMTSYAKKISDTAEFIRKYMSYIIGDLSQFDFRDLDLIEESINGSRMVILYANGQYDLLGSWVHEGDLWYSNSTYKGYTYKKDKLVSAYSWNNDSYVYNAKTDTDLTEDDFEYYYQKYNAWNKD